MPASRESPWIRPVSGREHDEVSEVERQYQDRSEPGLLDIMAVPLVEARPRDYHQENWLLDATERWVRLGRFPWTNLALLADPVTHLWASNYSTFNGKHDKVPLSQASELFTSLVLVHVDHIGLSVFAPSEDFGDTKRRVQGRFSYRGLEYRLWVTDPNYEREYLERPDGDYQIDESFLTISLSEPFNDSCYKLIAAIIERDKDARK